MATLLKNVTRVPPNAGNFLTGLENFNLPKINKLPVDGLLWGN